MCLTDNKKRHLKLTDSVHLAPAWDSSITKKADREIKNALFQFLKTVNCKVWASFSSTLYAAADWWLSTVRPAPLWLFSEFGAVYIYSDLLTYLLQATDLQIDSDKYVL